MLKGGLSTKLIKTYLLLFITLMILSFSGIYFSVRKTVQNDIENSLENSSYLINEMIQTTINASIKNHLRTTAESHLEMTMFYYDKYLNGDLSEEEAKAKTLELMGIMEIGTTGYMYVLNSEGVLVSHPFDEMQGRNISEWAFVKTQKTLKEGYIEYDWKNPGDDVSRPKALYMTYFEPWDWIVSASSYREEFLELIQIKDFEDQVLGLKFGEDGYSIVLDYEGRFLIHPKQKGRNVIEERDEQGPVIEQFVMLKNGILEYPWQNPEETEPRQKLTVLSDLPEYEWIISSTAYKDDFYGPINDLAKSMMALFVLSVVVTIIVTMKMSRYITKPLTHLKEKVLEGADGDLSVRIELNNDEKDEITELGKHFNTFMSSLESQRNELKELNENLEGIVERRTSELNQAHMKIVQIEKIQSMNELIKVIAHNMNTPLGNALLSTTFLSKQVKLLGDSCLPGMRNHVDIQKIKTKIDYASEGIVNSIKRSTELIEMFKVLAQSSDVISKETIYMRPFLEELIHRGAYDLEKIFISCDDDMVVEGYKDLLEIVLVNLISNAFEHAYEDGIFDVVTVKVVDLDNRFIITIEDQGKGILETDINRVFEPFYSKNKSMDTSGLGLSIVHNAVNYVMDGEVFIESDVDKGTTIRLSIPK